ncbi:hypothetical protein QF047_002494 [Arthrobacter sp. W4I7]|nr:hypothetical protein [Arthrobacter sp. W4I7]
MSPQQQPAGNLRLSGPWIILPRRPLRQREEFRLLNLSNPRGFDRLNHRDDRLNHPDDRLNHRDCSTQPAGQAADGGHQLPEGSFGMVCGHHSGIRWDSPEATEVGNGGAHQHL